MSGASGGAARRSTACRARRSRFSGLTGPTRCAASDIRKGPAGAGPLDTSTAASFTRGRLLLWMGLAEPESHAGHDRRTGRCSDQPRRKVPFHATLEVFIFDGGLPLLQIADATLDLRQSMHDKSSIFIPVFVISHVCLLLFGDSTRGRACNGRCRCE